MRRAKHSGTDALPRSPSHRMSPTCGMCPAPVPYRTSCCAPIGRLAVRPMRPFRRWCISTAAVGYSAISIHMTWPADTMQIGPAVGSYPSTTVWRPSTNFPRRSTTALRRRAAAMVVRRLPRALYPRGPRRPQHRRRVLHSLQELQHALMARRLHGWQQDPGLRPRPPQELL